MTSIFELIKFALNGNLLEDTYPKQTTIEHPSLPDRARQSLDTILKKIRTEKNPDRVNAFKVAYERILTYFWKNGYNKAEISYYFHDLNKSDDLSVPPSLHPNSNSRYVA